MSNLQRKDGFDTVWVNNLGYDRRSVFFDLMVHGGKVLSHSVHDCRNGPLIGPVFSTVFGGCKGSTIPGYKESCAADFRLAAQSLAAKIIFVYCPTQK